MRFTALTLSALASVSASVIPYYILGETNTAVELTSILSAVHVESLSQAGSINRNLNSAVSRVRDEATAESVKVLSRERYASTYDIPTELAQAFTSAQLAVDALPTPAAEDNTSVHYRPLVAGVRELFLTLSDVAYVGGEEVQADLNESDMVYSYVNALHEQLPGFGCALSRSVHDHFSAGKAVKAVSGQLYHLLFIDLPQGQCQ